MTTQEFIRKLVPENVDLLSRMQACKAPEEAYEVAKSVGLTDSFEEFTAEMTKFYESVKDLTEEDLANVAGGLTEKSAIVGTVTMTLSTLLVVATSLAGV